MGTTTEKIRTYVLVIMMPCHEISALRLADLRVSFFFCVSYLCIDAALWLAHAVCATLYANHLTIFEWHLSVCVCVWTARILLRVFAHFNCSSIKISLRFKRQKWDLQLRFDRITLAIWGNRRRASAFGAQCQGNRATFIRPVAEIERTQICICDLFQPI